MPSEYLSHFAITIEDALGNVFTDEFTLKERDILAVLSFGDYEVDEAFKKDINAEIQKGYQVIVPSRLIEYKKWKSIGFIARDPENGYAGMYIYSGLLGGATVVGVEEWPPETRKIFKEGCDVLSVIPHILAPEENSLYYKGDDMNVQVQYDITYDCDGVISNETRIQNYVLDTDMYSAGMHDLYATGISATGQEIRDSRPIWVIEFEIDEENVTKYFNPYKPDSARIKYSLEPDDYANPDISPKPISMKVEIKDKD